MCRVEQRPNSALLALAVGLLPLVIPRSHLVFALFFGQKLTNSIATELGALKKQKVFFFFSVTYISLSL